MSPIYLSSSPLKWLDMLMPHCSVRSIFFSEASLPLYPQLSKQEKQQQRKEKTRSKGPSECREKGAGRSRPDPNASSGADGDVSSEREP